MKRSYFAAFAICFSITFFACKKDNNNHNNPAVGKWQLYKIRIYTIGTDNAIINDTTYSGNTFTIQDYIQFNSNGTCISSISHLYYPTDEGFPKVPQSIKNQVNYSYTINGEQYILTQQLTPIPVGAGETNTATLNNDNLQVHTQTFGPTLVGKSEVSDAYYTRQ